MFCDTYVLELLRFETLRFCDARLSDINVVLCYVLSQYQVNTATEYKGVEMKQGECICSVS
jgi:hypothetical protein